MPQFFISSDAVDKDTITVSDKENYHHIIKVLRSKIGECLYFIDENRTQYKVVIKNIDSKSITTKVVETEKSNHYLNLQICLVQSVLKTDAQNFVIQKATELGVQEIIPVVTDNSVIKASISDDKIKTGKWQKIANEAVKQCERSDFPQILPRKTLEDILSSAEYSVKIACVERAQELSLKACLTNIKVDSSDKIAVIIGPEGGFSARELKLLEHAKDVYKVSLGKLILRAETAVISALSNIIYELEDDKGLH